MDISNAPIWSGIKVVTENCSRGELTRGVFAISFKKETCLFIMIKFKI